MRPRPAELKRATRGHEAASLYDGGVQMVRSSRVGPEARPVSIPLDFGPRSVASQRGVLTMPNRIWWSGATKVLDTNSREDLVRLYELVLTNGTEEDVRTYISYSELQELWEALHLPTYVARAWSAWFEAKGLKTH